MENEEFLGLYRTYEGLLREHGKEYRTVEESADDLRQNQMRIMRQMRNFLSHNANAGFLAVSEAQIQLLTALIKEERMAGDIVKNHLWTPRRASCEEGGKVSEAVLKMAKLKILRMPVTGEAGILGTVDFFKLAKLLCADAGCMLGKSSYGAYEKTILCVPPDMPVETLKEKKKENVPICCTADGRATGKFLGVWKEN